MADRSEEIRASFDAGANDYDRTRRMMVPCFDQFYAAALDLIPFDRDRRFDVLDLGAGTGLFSALIAAAFPSARITLADIAPQMLQQARMRFGDDPRFDFIEMDYSRNPLPRKFDAIVSALSIHHLEHYEKRALLQRIRESVSAGGIFVNAEVVCEDSESLERQTQLRWMEAASRAGATAADLEAARERQKHDRCAAVESQIQWLQAAGFSDVKCVFRDLIFAVFSARP